jgi:hypothetical protein
VLSTTTCDDGPETLPEQGYCLAADKFYSFPKLPDILISHETDLRTHNSEDDWIKHTFGYHNKNIKERKVVAFQSGR